MGCEEALVNGDVEINGSQLGHKGVAPADVAESSWLSPSPKTSQSERASLQTLETATFPQSFASPSETETSCSLGSPGSPSTLRFPSPEPDTIPVMALHSRNHSRSRSQPALPAGMGQQGVAAQGASLSPAASSLSPPIFNRSRRPSTLALLGDLANSPLLSRPSKQAGPSKQPPFFSPSTSTNTQASSAASPLDEQSFFLPPPSASSASSPQDSSCSHSPNSSRRRNSSSPGSPEPLRPSTARRTWARAIDLVLRLVRAERQASRFCRWAQSSSDSLGFQSSPPRVVSRMAAASVILGRRPSQMPPGDRPSCAAAGGAGSVGPGPGAGGAYDRLVDYFVVYGLHSEHMRALQPLLQGRRMPLPRSAVFLVGPGPVLF